MAKEDKKNSKNNPGKESQKVYNELLRKEMLRKLSEKAENNDEAFKKTLKFLMNEDKELQKKIYGG